jgi:glycosyltransferase involved in cell wall biosynthesis
VNPTVTGLVLTYNGERLLERCLASLAFCDELLVVDSQSTDASRDIAGRAGARVLARPWPGPVEQFRFALAEVKTDWVVSLDQDEFLSGELSANIPPALRAAGDLAGYYVPRRTFYFDRFMRHSGWYPDYLLRVFRRGGMEVTVSGAHYHFRPLGPTARLSGDIVHYAYANFREHLDKINAYAQQAADEMKRLGIKGGVPKAVLHGTVRFVKLYLLKAGFLDGRAGLINAAHGAFYAFLKYVRAMERGDWGRPS